MWGRTSTTPCCDPTVTTKKKTIMNRASTCRQNNASYRQERQQQQHPTSNSKSTTFLCYDGKEWDVTNLYPASSRIPGGSRLNRNEHRGRRRGEGVNEESYQSTEEAGGTISGMGPQQQRRQHIYPNVDQQYDSLYPTPNEVVIRLSFTNEQDLSADYVLSQCRRIRSLSSIGKAKPNGMTITSIDTSNVQKRRESSTLSSSSLGENVKLSWKELQQQQQRLLLQEEQQHHDCREKKQGKKLRELMDQFYDTSPRIQQQNQNQQQQHHHQDDVDDPALYPHPQIHVHQTGTGTNIVGPLPPPSRSIFRKQQQSDESGCTNDSNSSNQDPKVTSKDNATFYDPKKQAVEDALSRRNHESPLSKHFHQSFTTTDTTVSLTTATSTIQQPWAIRGYAGGSCLSLTSQDAASSNIEDNRTRQHHRDPRGGYARDYSDNARGVGVGLLTDVVEGGETGRGGGGALREILPYQGNREGKYTASFRSCTVSHVADTRSYPIVPNSFGIYEEVEPAARRSKSTITQIYHQEDHLLQQGQHRRLMERRTDKSERDYDRQQAMEESRLQRGQPTKNRSDDFQFHNDDDSLSLTGMFYTGEQAEVEKEYLDEIVYDCNGVAEVFDAKETSNGLAARRPPKSIPPSSGRCTVDRSDNNYLSDSSSSSPPVKEVRIEVSPGYFLPLRGSKETIQSIESGVAVNVVCISCDALLSCVPDCEMVVCPDCRCLTPMVIQDTEDDYLYTYDEGAGDSKVSRQESGCSQRFHNSLPSIPSSLLDDDQAEWESVLAAVAAAEAQERNAAAAATTPITALSPAPSTSSLRARRRNTFPQRKVQRRGVGLGVKIG